MPQTKKRRKFGRLEALILIPNVLLIGAMVIYVASTNITEDNVKPLLEGDPQLKARIADLEQALMRDPGDMQKAIELSRLYQEFGEFPWSYNALKTAEKNSGEDPLWRLRLGLAYLELGKNDDSLRVLTRALGRCREVKCPSPVQVKLDIFTRVVRRLKERKIDARKRLGAAEKALHEVLKPVKVDPQKMSPKAPAKVEQAAPETQPRPEPKS